MALRHRPARNSFGGCQPTRTVLRFQWRERVGRGVRRASIGFGWTAVTTVFVLSAAAASARMADMAAPSKRALYANHPERVKIASALLRARDLVNRRVGRAGIYSALPGVRFSAEAAVELDVRLWQVTPDVLVRIKALGFTVRHAQAATAQVAVDGPLDSLEQLAALPEVSTIHPRYAPRHRAGAVPDQADMDTGAQAARAAFAVDGSGVRVGILSDSFNDMIGGSVSGTGCGRVVTGSTPQLSGDLPSTVTVLNSGPGGGTDEGAAMAELVHDLAPGSDILFRAADGDESDFANGIDELRTCGADVIVDDTIIFSEPMFQDGFVAQAAKRALAAGIPVFSAAGNESTFGIEQTYVDSDPATDEESDFPTGVDFHDFGGGNKFARITIPAGCGIDAVLEWNEPFSGALGPGASTDLDLYLYSGPSASSTILADAATSQGCSRKSATTRGDPLEILEYTNQGRQAQTVYLAVDNFCGGGAPLFRIVTFGLNCGLPGGYGFDTSIFHAPQLYGHAAAEDVIAVGAVDYRELDSGGSFEGAPGEIDVERFSTLGGDLPFFFDDTGAPLPDAPEYRFKPELAAPDGVSTTFFGSNIGNGFPNFFGTSAAAPHAAAVAALVHQANPLVAPADMRRLLMDSARDIAAPGRDPLAGAGVVDADAAMADAVAASPTPTQTASPSPALSATEQATPTQTAPPSPTRSAPETAPSAASPSPLTTAATPSFTATPGGALAGDCDGSGRITVADLIRGIRIALGLAPLDDCPSFDRNGDGHVTIDEIIEAIDTVLAVA
jgi:hypothetical protein